MVLSRGIEAPSRQADAPVQLPHVTSRGTPAHSGRAIASEINRSVRAALFGAERLNCHYFGGGSSPIVCTRCKPTKRVPTTESMSHLRSSLQSSQVFGWSRTSSLLSTLAHRKSPPHYAISNVAP